VVGPSWGLWIDKMRESWVKELAKEAAVEDGPVVYDKMPREVILTQQKENGLHMWQRQWTDTVEGAVTKVFFPSVRNRTRQISCIPRTDDNANRTWENKIIPVQIWTER
jgi:hypothetical protein